MSEQETQKKDKIIYYHSHPHPKKTERTHTLCIMREEDTIYITWAKPLLGYDSFSRKTGIHIATGKMAKFIDSYPEKVIPCVAKGKITKAQLFMYLPAEVAATLPWYIAKAAKYYGGEPTKVAILCKDEGFRAVIEGDIAEYTSLI